MSNEAPKKDSFYDIILLLGAFMLFLLAPGMLVLAVFRHAKGANFDYGQMWSFAAVLSFLIWGCVWCWTRNFLRSLGYYVLLSLLAILGLFVAHFGFKAQFPRAFVTYYFPGSTTSSENAAHPLDPVHLQTVRTIVESYMRSRATKPNSLQFLEWSDLSTDGQTWAVNLRYSVEETSQQSTTSIVRFQVRNGKVISTQLVSTRARP